MKVKLNCITQPKVHSEEFDVEDGGMYIMNLEEYMIYCARVSSTERINNDTAPRLLKYLIDHRHWSPFEMISLGFEIETSRAIAQQILRHRSFSFQEFSQRYAQVDKFERIELRMQAEKNRQSSADILPDAISYYDSTEKVIDDHIENCRNLYENLLDDGVAKECARMVLPLSTQTTIVMHGTLRSWIHFLDQRCSEHAQKEIRLIAFEIRQLLSEQCPWTASAMGWNDA